MYSLILSYLVSRIRPQKELHSVPRYTILSLIVIVRTNLIPYLVKRWIGRWLVSELRANSLKNNRNERIRAKFLAFDRDAMGRKSKGIQ